MNYINSPIEKINFRNKDIFIKRDDLLDDDFSGNKARKFYYFLKKDFKKIEKIVSFGSCQANSLYSLSVLAKLKGVKLDFYVSHVPSYLKQNPIGNYKESLENGANIIEADKFDKTDFKHDEKNIFIEEGGRVKESEFGIKILANEIKKWAFENDIKDLKIVLPSGTGTTALYLQKNLEFEVFTCACVGDDEYLEKQFKMLEPNLIKYPKILKREKKYHFGKLYKEFYEIYLDLKKETNIEFDLLYDPSAWKCLIESEIFNRKNILYIHQGGIKGNISMLQRYENKFIKQNLNKLLE